MDYFKDMGIKLTDLQIERQIKRMKIAVFGEYEEYDDGSYKGEVNKEIIIILDNSISDKTQLTEIEYLNIITKCSMDLVEWMQKQVKGVDLRLATLYCFDFVNQTMGTLYNIEDIKDMDDDPMYS